MHTFMRFTSVLLVALWMVMSFVTGCEDSANRALRALYRPQPYKDVTGLPQYNFASFGGTVWKTKVKMALADVKRYTGAYERFLLAPVNFDSSNPDYYPAAEQRIIAVLPAGTRLHIERLMQDQGAWGGFQVEARLEGERNTREAVYLDALLLAPNRWSKGSVSDTNWTVNPEMLEKAN